MLMKPCSSRETAAMPTWASSRCGSTSATLASLQQNRLTNLSNGFDGCQPPWQHPADTDAADSDTPPAPQEELNAENSCAAQAELIIPGQDRCSGSADRRRSASWVARRSLLLEQLRPSVAAFASWPRPPSQLLGSTRLLFPHAHLAAKTRAAVEDSLRETEPPGTRDSREAVGDLDAAGTASPGAIQEGLLEQHCGGAPEADAIRHQEASEGGRSGITLDEALRGLLELNEDWGARVSEVLWSCEVPPDGWIKLRRELQPASALPSATSFLHGEAGPSGSHGAAQGGRDGQAASAAGGSAPGPKRGLSAVFEFAMRDRLESGGRGLSHVEDMLLIEEALDLLPSVLEGMRTARGPAYSDRRGQGAPRGNVWVCAKPQGRSSAAGAATLLKDLAVPHQCEAVYTANVAMMSWPLLVTDCKRFPAWGCLYSKAAQSPSAQPVLRHALRGLALMECGGVSLPWALEPGWGSAGEPPLDPVRLAAASMLHAALEACQADPGEGAADRCPHMPPPAVLYWAVAKVPPDTLHQLMLVLEGKPGEACPASPEAHQRPRHQQQAAVPEPLSPAHLELVAQAVVRHPMGVMAAVAEAMVWEVGPQAKGIRAAALQQLEEAVQLFAFAACCLATWRSQGGPAPAPAGPPTRPPSPQPPHQQHNEQRQPVQQPGQLRHRKEVAGLALSDSAPFDCVHSTPWAGPEALRRLQHAVQALAEYGWLEEPYGCTAASQQLVPPDFLGISVHDAIRNVLGPRGVQLVLKQLRVSADRALKDAGAQQLLAGTEEHRLSELAAFREARSAALCLRGAPLSGCQLRGVVEALRPGLLAAHPGTWGAAVRSAEEREQRGEQEDARLMVLLRAAVACLAGSARRTVNVDMRCLQLAPCALVGLLWPAQDLPAIPEALTHLSYQHLARHAVTDYAHKLFACVPYNLCDAIVRLLPGCPASSCNTTPTQAGPAAGVAATATAQTRPPTAPAAPVPSRQQQRLLDMYDRYLRILLYDMTCVVAAVSYSQCWDVPARHVTLGYLINALACVVAVQQEQQARGTAQHIPVVLAVPSPPPGIPLPPDDTWQLLTRAQAASARQQAVVDGLGLWHSDLLIGKAGRAGTIKADKVQGTYRSQVVLDSGGLQLGREVDPGVAGQVLSCLLLARSVGPRDTTSMQVVARGGEAVMLLALALHHRAKGLRDLMFAPRLLLPHTGNQEPLSSQRVYGGLRTGTCDDPSHTQQQQQQQLGQQKARLTSGQQEQQELEALVADCAVRLDMRLGTFFASGSDVAAQYPPKMELLRHTISVSAQCSWGSVLGALREPFRGRSRTHVAWVQGVGLMGLVRSIMLVAQLRKELNAEGREVQAGVMGVSYHGLLAAMAAPGRRQDRRKVLEAVLQRQGGCEPHVAAAEAFQDAAGALQAALAELHATEPGGGQRYERVLCGMADGGSGGAILRPRGAAGRRAWDAAVGALGVLLDSLREDTALGRAVRAEVVVEMQVVEVHPGDWGKLVPPVREAGEGRDAKGPGGKGALKLRR